MLAGTGLAVVFAVLIVREARPEWARHQRSFFEQRRVAAERALQAAEEALRRPDAAKRMRDLEARVGAAEAALAAPDAPGGYAQAAREAQQTERELSRVQDRLQRTRADYQRVERDFLLAATESERQRLRARLDELSAGVQALARDRDRLAAGHDAMRRDLRALTAERDAARQALAEFQQPLARAHAEVAAVRRQRPEVQQVLLDTLARVDRCPTCHVAAATPGFDQGAEPLRTHVGYYVRNHPVERFGCTVCHGGQGRATRLPAAHGRVLHWRERLLDRDLVGGLCAVCHRGDRIPGEPYAAAGRRLFVEAGCSGCHDVGGVTAPRIGPSLATIGKKVTPAWIAFWLRDPQVYLPRTRMPSFLLSDQEIADLSAFLLSLSTSPPTTAPSGGRDEARRSARASQADAVKRGETLYKESRCVTCHAVNDRGGTIGPDLGRVASKLRDGWLAEFLHDPARLSAGTKMPRYRFTDAEIADLAAYIGSELRDFDEASWPAPPQTAGRAAEGRVLVRKYGCFGCHEIPEFQRTGRVGAELTGYADKEVDRLDFGLRRDVPRTWRAWTDTKLRDPRGFRDGLKMPDHRFSEHDRFSLLTYLASLREEKPPAEYLREVNGGPRYEPEGRFGELAAELNCLVCHSIRGRGGTLAPDLTREGSRVRPEWLRRFLDRPNTIRLFLEERMPRFRLTPEEIGVIAGYIETVLVDAAVPGRVFAPGEITAALIERGRSLYFDTYGCNACHQIGMQGGAIGPDLTATRERLREGWVYAWLRNSRSLDATVREPVYELPDEEARAITAFLLSVTQSEAYRVSRD